MTLDEIKAEAREELKDQLRDGYEESQAIDEITDQAVPIHYGNLLEAAGDPAIYHRDVSEIGPAYDGELTPINVIASAIYLEVQEHLYEELEEIREELEEEALQDKQSECENCGELFEDEEPYTVGPKLCPDCEDALEEEEKALTRAEVYEELEEEEDND